MKRTFMILTAAALALSLCACQRSAMEDPAALEQTVGSRSGRTAATQATNAHTADPTQAAEARTRAADPTQATESRTRAAQSTQSTAAAAKLTVQEAEAIALEHAGFTADQVEHLRCVYDWDDGVAEYEVSFHVDRWEYEYDIDADTGAIRSYEKDE